jgi:hypothetical protein
MTEHLWGMTLIPKVVDDNPANIERYVTVSNYRLRGCANRRAIFRAWHFSERLDSFLSVLDTYATRLLAQALSANPQGGVGGDYRWGARRCHHEGRSRFAHCGYRALAQ